MYKKVILPRFITNFALMGFIMMGLYQNSWAEETVTFTINNKCASSGGDFAYIHIRGVGQFSEGKCHTVPTAREWTTIDKDDSREIKVLSKYDVVEGYVNWHNVTCGYTVEPQSTINLTFHGGDTNRTFVCDNTGFLGSCKCHE